MASPAFNVCRQALRRSHRTQWLSIRQRQAPSQAQAQARTFWSTPCMREDKGGDSAAAEGEASKEAVESEEEQISHFDDDFYKSLYSAAKDDYMQASPSERQQLESLHAEMQEELGPSSAAGQDMGAFVEREVYDARAEVDRRLLEKPDMRTPPVNDFFGQNDPESDIAPDEVWQDDDMTSLAHAQLDIHRELREYSRLAAWEMPMLSTLVTPFTPPSSTTSPLRWRYTTYLGTPHPAQHKVVLTFSPSHLSLTPAQRGKLIKLAGPRYDPHKQQVKMSAESFPSQAQNKRLLGTQFASLVKEAKDEKDTLQDVPFDFRHARRRPKHKFPREWALTEERRAYLQKLWAERETQAQVVEGVKMIAEARVREALEPVGVAAAGLGRKSVR